MSWAASKFAKMQQKTRFEVENKKVVDRVLCLTLSPEICMKTETSRFISFVIY